MFALADVMRNTENLAYLPMLISGKRRFPTKQPVPNALFIPDTVFNRAHFFIRGVFPCGMACRDSGQVVRVEKLDHFAAHCLRLLRRITKGGKPVPVNIDVLLFYQIKDIDCARFGVQNPLKHMPLIFKL